MSAQKDPEARSPAGSQSAAPVLSFKKQRNKTSTTIQNTGFGSRSAAGVSSNLLKDSKTESANVSQSDTSTSAPATPVSGGERRTSSRRKALQDFYKMNPALENTDGPVDNRDITNGSPQILVNGEKSGQECEKDITDNTVNTDNINGSDIEVILNELNDEEAFEKFMKTASAKEILRVRNAAANKLNYHDSERKSMIYNNYSELIKLNDILSNVFQDTNTVSEFSQVEDENVVTNSSIDACLADLASFLETEASVFNQDFASVVESVCSSIDGSDSVASVRGIVGEN